MTRAQTQPSDEMPLWPAGQVPGSLGSDPKDIPTLTLDRAATTQPGAAVVICPGGGYAHLAPHEGAGYANWLSQQGVQCFVLKYRLGSDLCRAPAPASGATAINLFSTLTARRSASTEIGSEAVLFPDFGQTRQSYVRGNLAQCEEQTHRKTKREMNRSSFLSRLTCLVFRTLLAVADSQ